MGKLWYGGTIYTLEREYSTVEAVYTEDGYIRKTGLRALLEAEYGQSITEKIDLQGKTMLPGFVDSHMHLIGHGEKLIRLDLSSYTSKESVLSAVKAHAEKMEKGEWIVGEGWNENLWEHPEPIRIDELDEAVSGHPVILKRVCRHALTANSAALKLASINDDTEAPAGGVIEKNSGKLTGIFKDQAQELILSAMPAITESYLERAMTAAIENLYEFGITGAHTEDLNYYGSYKNTINTFHSVIEKKGLRFRAHLLIHHGVIDEALESGTGYLSGSEWIEFGAMKIFSDGALGGRTALLSQPYYDAPDTSGVAIFSQEELNDLVKKARLYNLPVAIHAIGDYAFEMCLNAIEMFPLEGKGRDRMIHGQILRKELIERAARLPLIIDIQPQFLSSDYPWVIDRIGPDRMKYCYAWKTLLNNAIPCAGGSDSPIEEANPLLGIHAAVSRRTSNSNDLTVYQPSEKLSVFEAVSLFTKGSAFAICHEQDRGMIKEDFLADFTVLDQDIFKVNPLDIPKIKAVMTIIGEEKVYERSLTSSGI